MDKVELIEFIVLINILLLGLVAGVLVFVFQYRRQKIHTTEEQANAERRHELELMHTKVNSQQALMHYIAREIHDNVGQKLTLASIYSKQHEHSRQAIQHISKMVDESLHDLRELSKSLKNPDTLSATLIDLLGKEAERIRIAGPYHADITGNAGSLLLSNDVKLQVFRLVQEFIQNSLKHARCRKIHIDVKVSDAHLVINASDDGVGFDLAKITRGIGLDSMEGRARELGGAITISSIPGAGTSVLFVLPLTADNQMNFL